MLFSMLFQSPLFVEINFKPNKICFSIAAFSFEAKPFLLQVKKHLRPLHIPFIFGVCNSDDNQ